MYAGSFLGGVRDVERRIDEILATTTLVGESMAWRHAIAVRATLLDLAELLEANAPIPIDADTGDRSIRAVLDARYRLGPCSPTRLSECLPDGEATVERLSDDDRIEVVDSWVMIPLNRATRNWPAVILLLKVIYREVACDARRIHHRVLADGASEDDALVRAWDGLVGMVEVLVDLLTNLSGYGQYIDKHDRTDDSGTTEFTDWTITQLTK